ncbi:MAG: glucuronyl esterase domain-containing protein [Thermoproteota archaeon]
MKQDWHANPDLVRKLGENRPDVIYDEARVPPYTLPNPLVSSDGLRIATPELWMKERRPEILELFRTHVYGRTPIDRPDGMSFEVFDLDREALGGKATRKQVEINFTGSPEGPIMDLLIYLPNGPPRPLPTFLMLNFNGNHTFYDDPAIRIRRRSTRVFNNLEERDFFLSERSRGWGGLPQLVEKTLARGYGFATACYNDIDPDFHDGFKNGVHGAFDKLFGKERPPDAWGSIGAWAWGLSRAMDYLEDDEEVDGKRVVIVGHSRLGKTALWAGAQDERFAVAISNNSGCGGAALSRRKFGETVKLINTVFPHWFCENFKRYNDLEEKLPVDQHMLIALIAPRPVYVASADEDLWADPRGEFLAAKAANPVYRLLGKDGLPVEEMPPLNHPVLGTIGYHIRSGGHGLNLYDWERYMDFADRHFSLTIA